MPSWFNRELDLGLNQKAKLRCVERFLEFAKGPLGEAARNSPVQKKRTWAETGGGEWPPEVSKTVHEEATRGEESLAALAKPVEQPGTKGALMKLDEQFEGRGISIA